MLDTHSADSAAVEPLVFFVEQVPVVPVVILQYAVSPQSVWEEQDLRQPVSVHSYAPQSWGFARLHAPWPLQVTSGVNVAPLHTPGVHTWLALTLRQVPEPSQVPSFPHSLLAVWSAHASCGSLPLSTGAHVPSVWPVSADEHALHPPQVVPQQTPSTQLPRAQSTFAEQFAPTCKDRLGSPEASAMARVPLIPASPEVSRLPPVLPPAASLVAAPPFAELSPLTALPPPAPPPPAPPPPPPCPFEPPVEAPPSALPDPTEPSALSPARSPSSKFRLVGSQLVPIDANRRTSAPKAKTLVMDRSLMPSVVTDDSLLGTCCRNGSSPQPRHPLRSLQRRCAVVGTVFRPALHRCRIGASKDEHRENGAPS